MSKSARRTFPASPASDVVGGAAIGLPTAGAYLPQEKTSKTMALVQAAD